MLLILDILLQDIEAVDFGGKPGGDRSPGLILGLGEFARRSRGIGGDHRLELHLSDNLAALAERMDVAVHRFEARRRGAGHQQELVMDAQEVFADDIEIGGGQQMMDVGDASGDRIVDGNHREIDLALLHGGKGVLECPRSDGLVARIGFAAGNMRIGAGLALIGDLGCHLSPSNQKRLAFSFWRAASRSAGVSTPKGAVSTSATSMRMPAASARNCSSLSHCSSLPGGKRTKRWSAARRKA